MKTSSVKLIKEVLSFSASIPDQREALKQDEFLHALDAFVED